MISSSSETFFSDSTLLRLRNMKEAGVSSGRNLLLSSLFLAGLFVVALLLIYLRPVVWYETVIILSIFLAAFAVLYLLARLREADYWETFTVLRQCRFQLKGMSEFLDAKLESFDSRMGKRSIVFQLPPERARDYYVLSQAQSQLGDRCERIGKLLENHSSRNLDSALQLMLMPLVVQQKVGPDSRMIIPLENLNPSVLLLLERIEAEMEVIAFSDQLRAGTRM